MQRYNPPTINAHPLFSLFTQVLLRTDALSSKGIVNQADLISLPIAFIKTFDYGTRER